MDAFLLRLVAETSSKPNPWVLILSAIILVLCAIKLIRIDPRISNFVKSQRTSGHLRGAKRKCRGVAAYPLRLIAKLSFMRYALVLIPPIIVLVAWSLRGTREDPRVSGFLRSPSVVERYKGGNGIDPNNQREKISPLIKQAQLFAQYLNPPQAPNEEPAKRTVRSVAPRPSFSSITAKFTLRGTCYQASQPEESMALIWQPGGGGGTLQWVKQGVRLGHFVVDEIKAGSITYTGGGQKHEMKVQHRPAQGILVREERTDPGRASNRSEALKSVALNSKRFLAEAGKEKEAAPK